MLIRSPPRLRWRLRLQPQPRPRPRRGRALPVAQNRGRGRDSRVCLRGRRDRPALLEDRAEALEKSVDLLGGNILPRQEYMLIERHGLPSLLRCSGAKPRMGALEGKAQETTLRAETREGGDQSLPL